MKSGKQAYHHGNLQQTLLTAAKAILQSSEPDSLSMRRLAEDIGVSRSAAYHHFEDKNALLCAIAEDGFLQQAALQKEMLQNDAPTNPVQRFEQLTLAYVSFAVENPRQYALMYGGDIWKSKSVTPSLKAAANHSFKHWLAEVERLQQLDLMQADIEPLRLAQVTWAMLHGLCCLWNDGVYVNPDNLAEMSRSAVRLMLTPPREDAS